eukprot:403347251
MDEEVINAKKDTTRPSNVYYGLNWGFRSDNTIEKSLDTGDLLYFDYNCLNCFEPNDVIKCYIQQKQLKDDQPQNVAFCFRTPQRLFVIASHFGGQIQIIPYHEFLNKPFIKTVKVRTLQNQPINLIEASAQFVQQIREQNKVMDKEHKDFFSQMLLNRLKHYFIVNPFNQHLVAHYFYHLKVIKQNPFQEPYITAQDLDEDHPRCFYQAYDLSNPVMIRTYASQNLLRKNVT